MPKVIVESSSGNNNDEERKRKNREYAREFYKRNRERLIQAQKERDIKKKQPSYIKKQKGFQCGHPGFLAPETYANRKKSEYSEYGLIKRKESAIKSGIAKRGKNTAKKGKHSEKWSEAARKAWETKRANPETMKQIQEKAKKNGAKGLASLHARSNTYIEQRFQEALEMFGLEEGKHFLRNHTVKTNKSWRFPDFLFANHIIVEVDGEQWHKDKEKDAARDAELTEVGFTTYRFTGKQINNNMVQVVDSLIRIINDRVCVEGPCVTSYE